MHLFANWTEKTESKLVFKDQKKLTKVALKVVWNNKIKHSSGFITNYTKFKFIGGKKLQEEVKKYPILCCVDKCCKGCMVKNTNCFSAKRYHETNIVFSFLRRSFKVLCCFIFRKKSIKRNFIFFDLFIINHNFLKKMSWKAYY